MYSTGNMAHVIVRLFNKCIFMKDLNVRINTFVHYFWLLYLCFLYLLTKLIYKLTELWFPHSVRRDLPFYHFTIRAITLYIVWQIRLIEEVHLCYAVLLFWNSTPPMSLKGHLSVFMEGTHEEESVDSESHPNYFKWDEPSGGGGG